MSKSEDATYEQLEGGTVCGTLRWLRDETGPDSYSTTDADYIYNQFDLVLDILTQAGWR